MFYQFFMTDCLRVAQALHAAGLLIPPPRADEGTVSTGGRGRGSGEAKGKGKGKAKGKGGEIFVDDDVQINPVADTCACAGVTGPGLAAVKMEREGSGLSAVEGATVSSQVVAEGAAPAAAAVKKKKRSQKQKQNKRLLHRHPTRPEQVGAAAAVASDAVDLMSQEGANGCAVLDFGAILKDDGEWESAWKHTGVGEPTRQRVRALRNDFLLKNDEFPLKNVDFTFQNSRGCPALPHCGC